MPSVIARSGLVALTVLALGITSPSTASAKVSGCSVYRSVENQKLANAGVTSVRNMSCGDARQAIRRYGRRSSQAPYRDAGAHFGLGPWSCSIYLHDYELWRARCVNGGRAFRVDYGF
jgi:hypothetical protein